MAIVKGIAISKLSGRVGNVVFRNRDGVNVASEKAASVKNPRTEAQQKQRMVFNTVVQAYSTLKSIADHSFEGVSSGSKSQSEFLRRNLQLLQGLRSQGSGSYIAKGNSSLAPNDYMISKGSITPLEYIAQVMPNAGVAPTADNIELRLQSTTAITPTATLADIMEAYNLQLGDEVTFLFVVGTGNRAVGLSPTGNPYQLTSTELKKARFVISTSATVTSNFFNTADDSLNSNLFSETENLGDFYFMSTNNQFAIQVIGSDNNAVQVLAVGAIISRKSGSSYLRSTQYLTQNWEDYLTATSLNGYVESVAINSYDPNDPLYLNVAQ